MIVAAIGHRPERLGGETSRLFDLAWEWLRSRETHWVLSSLAPGWPQAAAGAAYWLDIPFSAAIPYEDHCTRFRKDQRRQFEFLRERAESGVLISPRRPMGSREGVAIYHRCQRWLVDEADAVLALYDGNPTGGTYMTLCYASAKGKPVVNLWSSWRKYGSTSPRLLEMPVPQSAS